MARTSSSGRFLVLVMMAVREFMTPASEYLGLIVRVAAVIRAPAQLSTCQTGVVACARFAWPERSSHWLLEGLNEMRFLSAKATGPSAEATSSSHELVLPGWAAAKRRAYLRAVLKCFSVSAE